MPKVMKPFFFQRIPRLWALRTFKKSSRKPMKAITTMPIQMIIAWSEKARPWRKWAMAHPTNAAPMIARPPIVGVPALAMWWSGPRSSLPRIGWPLPRSRKNTIR